MLTILALTICEFYINVNSKRWVHIISKYKPIDELKNKTKCVEYVSYKAKNRIKTIIGVIVSNSGSYLRRNGSKQILSVSIMLSDKKITTIRVQKTAIWGLLEFFPLRINLLWIGTVFRVAVFRDVSKH